MDTIFVLFSYFVFFIPLINVNLYNKFSYYFFILLFQYILIIKRKHTIKRIEKLTSKSELNKKVDSLNTKYISPDILIKINTDLNKDIEKKQALIDKLILDEEKLKNQLNLNNKEKKQASTRGLDTNIKMPNMSNEVISPSFLLNKHETSSLKNQHDLAIELKDISDEIYNLDYDIKLSKLQIARLKELDLSKNNIRLNFSPYNSQNTIPCKEKYYNFMLEESEIYFIQNNIVKLKEHLQSIDNTKLIGNQDDIYICLHDKLSSFKNYSIEHKNFGILGYMPQDIINDLTPILSICIALEADWMISDIKKNKNIKKPNKNISTNLQVEIEMRVYWEEKNGY